MLRLRVWRCLALILLISVTSLLYLNYPLDTKLVHDFIPQKHNSINHLIRKTKYKARDGSIKAARSGVLFGNHWPQDKALGVVYYLIKDINTNERMWQSLRSVNHNFMAYFAYPIIIFYDGKISIERKFRIQKMLSLATSVHLHQVNLSTPSWVNEAQIDRKITPSYIGYRHMCRFHALLVAQHPALNTAEYMLRLDDDSNILEKLTQDPFQSMADNEQEYGYIAINQEKPFFHGEIFTFAHNYIAQHNIRPTFFYNWHENDVFYNNFELSRIQFWLQPQVIHFLDQIDKSGEIYYHRWGDGPIHTLAVAIFMEKEKVACLAFISYQHHLIVNKASEKTKKGMCIYKKFRDNVNDMTNNVLQKPHFIVWE